MTATCSRFDGFDGFSAVKKDNRGAIMVLGVFFACMMIGWMWMLVGLGDAMIWRDRSQEAADAVTYSSAAVQAQAMNLISFVNILMLIMAALYLLISFVYNLLDLFHVLLGSTGDGGCLPGESSSADSRADKLKMMGEVPYIGIILEAIGNVWVPAATAVETLHDGSTNGAPSPWSVGGILDKYESLMIATMPKLSDFEDIVAYAAPWAGTVLGAYTGSQFKDYGQDRWGLALSSSLVPATLTPGVGGSGLPVQRYKSCADDECTKPVTCNAQDPNQCTNYNGGDKREGLPVQIPNGGFTALCDFVGAKISMELQSAFSNMGIPFIGTLVGMFMSAISTKISKSYCYQNGRGLFSPVDSTISVVMRVLTLIPLPVGGTNNNETCPQNNWGHGKSGASGGPKPCNYVYEMKLGDGNQFWQDPQFAGGPHLVVDYAMNGNDWMQVWGAVWGGNLDSSTSYQITHSERLVATAGMQSSPGHTWSQTIGVDSSNKFSLYMSQAEFYYDCDNVWGDADCNKSSNASYAIGWRARLRRMHGLSWGNDLLNYVYQGSFGPNSGLAARYKQLFAQQFTNKLVGTWGATITNAGLQWLIGQGGKAVGGAINPASVAPDFIH